MSKTSPGLSKRVATGLLAVALSVFGLAFAGPAAASNHETSTERLAGGTRFGTAADVCAQLNEDEGIETVVIASGRNFPDALAASPLAVSEGGCILLVEPDSLPEDTLAALDEVAPSEVVIVGGTAAVSQDVEDAIEDEGFDTTRVAGDTREETAVAVAERIGAAGIEDGTVILATGNLAPDALAAGGIAGGTDAAGVFPILLARGDSLTAETEAAIEELATNVIVVGGTAAVSESAADQAGEAAGDDDVERLAGQDRHETAVAIAQFAIDSLGFEIDEIILAAGRPPAEIGTFSPDALVAGPLAAARQAPILLTVSTEEIGEANETFLNENGGLAELVLCIGGTAVISNAACDQAAAEAEEAEVPQTGNQTVTTRPELVSAAIGTTTTATQVTPTTPAGTTVAFTFDEAVSTLPGFTPVAGNFRVYSGSNTQYTGSGTPTISTDGKTVTVNFATLNTTALAGTLTLATVDFGAVRDTGGAENPEGDAPIGTAVTTTPAAAAGVTSAPDLVSVGNFRQASTTGFTAVDFTFDQAANVATTTGFHLVTTDGQNVQCTSSSTAGVPSGGTVPGGTGTTTITVTCDNPDIGSTTNAALTTSNVARGYVEAGSVSTGTAGSGVNNPLQAADVAGSSTDPDLVSVSFSAGDANSDTAVFTFDQNIIQATPSLFRAYDNSAAPITPQAVGGGALGTCVTSTSSSSTTTCTINPSNPTQVLVYFANNALASAVGGNVDALGAAGTFGATIVQNEPDEEAAAPTTGGTATTQNPGQTTGPNLTAVALVQGTDPFGNAGSYRARYSFDEIVTVQTVGEFHLYLADGTRLVATTCTVGASATATPNNTQVDCTAYTATTAATSAQIGAAVLGTVGFDAVRDAQTQSNPEGGEVTTGGTGTPATA